MTQMYTPSIHLNASIKTDYVIFLKKNAKMHGRANSNRIENEKIGRMAGNNFGIQILVLIHVTTPPFGHPSLLKAGKFSELLLEPYGKSGTFVDFCNGKTIPAKRSESK